MKCSLFASLLLALDVVGVALAGSPLGKALEFVDSLNTKIQANADAEDKAFDSFKEWCGEQMKTADHDFQTASDKKEQLEAVIAKASNDAEVASSKIERFASAEQTAESEREKADEVGARADVQQDKAQAEGDLATNEKDLANAQDFRDVIKNFCMRASEDHEATKKARNSDLSAIAGAQKALSSTIGGESSSLLMVGKKGMSASGTQESDPTNKAADLVNRLAARQQSATLAQLATNMEAMIRLGEYTGQDVFKKIKSMLTDMLAKLQRESEDDVTEKAFCDEQLAKNTAHKTELEDEVEKRHGKMDESTAAASELVEDVKDLRSSLAALAKNQVRMTSLHQEAQTALEGTKDVLNGGLQSVRYAIDAVRDSGKNLKDLLELVDSSIATHLTAVNVEADGLESGYEKIAQMNAVTKALKEKDVEYKTREQTSLQRSLSEAQSDSESTGSELSAVKEFQDQLKSRCIAKPDSYKERKQRREEELQGLKEALDVLEGDSIALLQRSKQGLQQNFLGMRAM